MCIIVVDLIHLRLTSDEFFYDVMLMLDTYVRGTAAQGYTEVNSKPAPCKEVYQRSAVFGTTVWGSSMHHLHHGNDPNGEYKFQRTVCNDFGASGSRLRALGSDRGESAPSHLSPIFPFTWLLIRPTT